MKEKSSPSKRLLRRLSDDQQQDEIERRDLAEGSLSADAEHDQHEQVNGNRAEHVSMTPRLRRTRTD